MNLAQTQSVTLAPKITSAKTLLAQQDDAAVAEPAAEAPVETPAEEAAPVVEAVEEVAADIAAAEAAPAEEAAAPVVEEAAPVTEEVVVADPPAAEIVDPAAIPQVSDAAKVIPATSATGVDPAVAERKAWCVDKITPNFFAAPGDSTSGVDQFNTFVNTLCPALDLKVPSK